MPQTPPEPQPGLGFALWNLFLRPMEVQQQSWVQVKRSMESPNPSEGMDQDPSRGPDRSSTNWGCRQGCRWVQGVTCLPAQVRTGCQAWSWTGPLDRTAGRGCSGQLGTVGALRVLVLVTLHSASSQLHCHWLFHLLILLEHLLFPALVRLGNVSQVNIEQPMNPCFWLSTFKQCSQYHLEKQGQIQQQIFSGLLRSAPQFNEAGDGSELSYVLKILRAKLLSWRCCQVVHLQWLKRTAAEINPSALRELYCVTWHLSAESWAKVTSLASSSPNP